MSLSFDCLSLNVGIETGRTKANEQKEFAEKKNGTNCLFNIQATLFGRYQRCANDGKCADYDHSIDDILWLPEDQLTLTLFD